MRFISDLIRLVVGTRLWLRLRDWADGDTSKGTHLVLNGNKLDVPFTWPTAVAPDGVVRVEPNVYFLALGEFSVAGKPEGIRNVSFEKALVVFFETGLGLFAKEAAELSELEHWLHHVVWPEFERRKAARISAHSDKARSPDKGDLAQYQQRL